MPRARDLGIVVGALPPGPTNSVLDVAGAGLGHATVHRDEPAPPDGRGVARTGVTCVLLAEDAYLRPVPAGGAVLNGAGECTGFLTAAEWGSAETPVYLTSTMQLGRVYDAACEITLEQHPEAADDVVIPVVAECDDSFLNDCRRMQVTGDDVRTAWRAAVDSVGAGSPPAEGAVGSGTGMSCFDFKGGIGTASRVTGDGHTVAVVLMTNFGVRQECVVAGVPVGRLLPPARTGPHAPAGSCIGLVV
ncbi:MAG TPA: P1 family peptidase, partial [Nocardioides sp.]|uniref:P1 family peptidase n=1 Tax=Nocardioides sp. TaxID=35761 RepID=UPI002C8A8179